MKTKWTLFAAAAVAIAATATPALAQQPEGAPRKAEVQRKIKNLRHKLLVDKVGLSDAKAAQVEQVIEDVNAQRGKLKKQIAEERKTLRELLAQNSDDQSSYQGALDRLRTAEKSLRELNDKELDGFEQALTPKEQAKLVQALHHFRKKVAHKLLEKRKHGDDAEGK